MAIVETKINGLWVAKQTAKGSPASTAIKRLRQVAGNVRTDRSDGRERYGTDSRYGSAQHFVDTLAGSGDPGVQAQPGALAYLLYLLAGQESVSGAGDPYTHTITPAAAGGFWTTFWKKVGVSDIVRERFNDCRIGGVTIEGSTGQKVVRITPTIISLDPGEKVAADPVKAEDVDDAFLYTEAESAFEINGAVVRGQSQFSVTISEALDPVYTDSVRPLELVAGEPEVTVGLTLALNSEGLDIYHREIYGTTTPTAGTKPIDDLPALGSYEFNATKSANRTFGFELPGIKWTPDVAVEANPGGGLTEVSLAGELQMVAGQPAWRAIIKNADAAYA